METTRYVDVTVFVYWLGKPTNYGETTYKWGQKIENSTCKEYFTSSLTEYETLVIIAGIARRNLKGKAFVETVTSSLTHT